MHNQPIHKSHTSLLQTFMHDIATATQFKTIVILRLLIVNIIVVYVCTTVVWVFNIKGMHQDSCQFMFQPQER